MAVFSVKNSEIMLTNQQVVSLWDGSERAEDEVVVKRGKRSAKRPGVALRKD